MVTFCNSNKGNNAKLFVRCLTEHLRTGSGQTPTQVKPKSQSCNLKNYIGNVPEDFITFETTN
ncbi:MAG: hypothetical protein ACTHNW_04975 [Mucilaginibacter sp.]